MNKYVCIIHQTERKFSIVRSDNHCKEHKTFAFSLEPLTDKDCQFFQQAKLFFSCGGKRNAFSPSTGDHTTEQFRHVQKPLKNQCSVVRNRCSMLRLLPSVNCIMLRIYFCPLLFWGGLGNGHRASYVSAGVWQLYDRNVFRLNRRKTVGNCRVAGFEVDVSLCMSLKKTWVRWNSPLSSVVKLKGTFSTLLTVCSAPKSRNLVFYDHFLHSLWPF